MSEWGEVTLGDLMTLDVNTVDVDPAQTYDIVGMLNRGRGLLYRESMAGSKTAYKTLNRIGPNQVVYSRLKAFEGAITVAPANLHEAYASQEFPTFTCGPSLMPGYFRLLTTTKRLWDTLQNLSTGMGGRRERVKPKDFLTIKIALPSIAEQRRIVEVLGAVDAQVQALNDELERAANALDSLVTNLLSEMPRTRTLADFTSTRSGPSYAAADVTSEPVEGSTPVIGIPNTRPDGTIDLSEIGYVSGLPRSVSVIDESSLVLIRTNGNRQRIGNVYLPPAEAHGCAVSAFQFLLKVADPADREYVYWALRERRMQVAMSEAASGTTGLGNLAVKWLNSAQVYWSNDAGQRVAATASLRAQQSVVDGLRDELAHLHSFRSSLLSALLNQEIEIPESYDLLVEVS